MRNKSFYKFKSLLTVGAMLVVALPAHAASLSASDNAQLQTWLGQGEVTLTGIFSSLPSSTSFEFHAAADGKGATFTVMNVTENGVTKIIGGYNPQSWNSSSGYTIQNDSEERAAFIFNLTDSLKYNQRLDGTPCVRIDVASFNS
jgi:hypothetical protein